jgi:hypothetical protein
VKRALLALPLLLAACGVRPTDVIPGTPSTGALIYLVQGNTPVPVVRLSRNQPRPNEEALSLLAEGPTAAERDRGFTNEVPSTAFPFTVNRNTIGLLVDPNSLSTMAVAQIACTAAISRPVTLVGGGQTRGSGTCPI